MSKSDITSAPFSLVADFDGDIDQLFDVEVTEPIPVLPLRNMVLFPGVIAPITIGRSTSLKLIKEAAKNESFIALVCQQSADDEAPELKDLHQIGTLGKVIRLIELPDQTTTALVQGYSRISLEQEVSKKPYLKAYVSTFPETLPESDDDEFRALAAGCRDMTLRYIMSNEQVRDEAAFAIKNIKNNVALINFIATNIPLPTNEKIGLLLQESLHVRAFRLMKCISRETQFMELKATIQERTRQELDEQQKNYFLQQELKHIQQELGDGFADEIQAITDAANKKTLPAEVRKTLDKEIGKLRTLNPQSPDYSIQLTYLQTFISLPWGECSKDNLNLNTAERTLNRDHYGLEKVKERILEHLSVLKMRGDMKAPIICLYGPPGVGKTSLGKSIAEALKRKYIRIALGGVHDEAEIRGHRRTYIGAMPGRIIKSIVKAGTNNPVFLLDEIDKVGGHSHHGDPSSALLEVLDPEQNTAFHDNYLDVDYDLSKVLFIATANNISNIPTPLLDRMELIPMSGYIIEEKVEIAKRHLLTKALKENGLDKEVKVKLPNETIEHLVDNYTRESGVRQLEQQINKVLRKLTHRHVLGKLTLTRGSYTVQVDELTDLLGKPTYTRERYEGNKYAGVVTGLAWTSAGGDVLLIETSLHPGTGKLSLTGNLGDVMKESAQLALQHLKANASRYGIAQHVFEQWDIHLHFPAGAIPKDGPSAGITISTALVSLMTQRRVRPNVAMTGEVSLRGKVLPVGGIKEKILAAKRAGITDIVLCEENRKDIEEIAPIYLEGLSFRYAETLQQVIDFALLNELVEDPLDLSPRKMPTAKPQA